MGLFSRVAKAVKKVAKKIKKKAKQIYEDVKDDAKEAVDETVHAWQEAARAIKSCAGTVGCITAVVGGVVSAVLETGGAIVDLAFDAAGWLVETGLAAAGVVIGGALAIVAALLPEVIGNVLSRIAFSVIDWYFYLGRYVSHLLDAIGGLLQRLIRVLVILSLFVLVVVRVLYCAFFVTLLSNTYPEPAPRTAVGSLCRHSIRTLELEVIIVDKDEKTTNPIAAAELRQRVADANRILREQAKIEVILHGSISRMTSNALYNIDGTGSGLSEWLKGPGQLLGRNNPRHLTVYAVGTISGDPHGLHEPLYGSVFVLQGNPPTTLAHEIGHALLSVDRMGHRADSTNLMYATSDRERVVGWPQNTPTLTEDQWCSMRQSRWLNWAFECDQCVRFGRQ